MAHEDISNSSYYSSPPATAPSSPLFSVYLSVCGEDTWNTFTGHLSAALSRAGFTICKDDRQIPRKKSSPDLIDSIHESMVAIVVLSKNYYSSQLCMDELVGIMEWRKGREHNAVIPVYYDVGGEAFEIHERAFVDTNKVKLWAAAVQDVGDLKGGFALTDSADGNEAVLIKRIVEEVGIIAKSKEFSYVAEYPVRIESCIQDIYKKLRIGEDDVRFILIHGMGGIGKTLLAKAICNRTFHHFERSCFLADIREAASSEHYGLLSLQSKLVSQLLQKNYEVNSVKQGIDMIRDGLRSKRVLLILDDLDQVAQLESLAGCKSWFGLGSRVIITSRNASILRGFQFDFINVKYEVMELDWHESLELFSRHAFRSTIPIKDFMELSHAIVTYTGGLPLALRVIGSDLHGKTMQEWKTYVANLQQFLNREIQKILRVSYDALDSYRMKEVFLDISCFFIGMDKDEAISILNGGENFAHLCIRDLRERCLLTVDGINKLRMHNLIRDMGREIVREESRDPPRQSRLWHHEDAFNVLRNLKGTEVIRGIKQEVNDGSNEIWMHNSIPVTAPLLHKSTYDQLKDVKGSENIEGVKSVTPVPEKLHLSTIAFERMCNLEILQISNVHLTGSFEDIFAELRWFCWRYCHLACLPSSFEAPKLVVLDMQHSNLTRLWDGTKHLFRLKVLNLSHSPSLITTPDFKGLEMLEKLLLQNCTSLEHIDPSIEHLTSLTHLDLNGCSKLNRLPNQLGELKSLKRLDASGTAINKLPYSLGELFFLEELCLEDCTNLKTLPSSICKLTLLKVVRLRSCPKLETLPEKFGNICSLKQLDASDTAIKQLPTSVRQLRKLSMLSLEGCQGLKQITSSSSNLSLHLTEMVVLDLEVNKYFTEVKASILFHHIKLSISVSPLQQLPPTLENIIASGCTSLETLPTLFNLSCLKSLNLENCSRLQQLPDLPPNLSILDLTNCSFLRTLPDLHPKLKHLRLTGCNSLELLPEIPPGLEFLAI